MLKTLISLVLAGTALVGCTRASTTMLTPDTAIISGRGTAFDSAGGVLKATLQEAAKQTKERGYRYFQIVGGQDASSSSAYYVPGQTYSTTTGSATGTTYGGNTYLSGTAYTRTTTTPGYAGTMVRPGVDVAIRMYAEGQINPATPGVFDANAILATK